MINELVRTTESTQEGVWFKTIWTALLIMYT